MTGQGLMRKLDEAVTELVTALPHGASVTVQFNPYLVIEYPIVRCVLCKCTVSRLVELRPPLTPTLNPTPTSTLARNPTPTLTLSLIADSTLSGFVLPRSSHNSNPNPALMKSLIRRPHHQFIWSIVLQRVLELHLSQDRLRELEAQVSSSTGMGREARVQHLVGQVQGQEGVRV